MSPKSGLQRYLEATGVLEWGTIEQIEEAKKYYKKLYQRSYKQRQRKVRPEIILSLSKDDHAALSNVAKKHHIKLASFVRDAALAYTQQQFLIPNEKEIIELREYLALIGYDIKRLREEATQSGEIGIAELYHLLLDQITKLEEYTREKLEHPPLSNHAPTSV